MTAVSTDPFQTSAALVQPRGARLFLKLASQHALPLFGVIFLGWSVAVIVLIYWLENLVRFLLWHRIVHQHARLTRVRGHLAEYDKIKPYWLQHAIFFPGFTLVHGLVLAILVFGAMDARLLPDQWPLFVLAAFAVVLGCAIEILPQRRGLERRSFAWLLAESSAANVWAMTTMHLGVLFGFLFMGLDWIWTGWVWVGLLFIGLRVIADLMVARARARPGWAQPPQPFGRDELEIEDSDPVPLEQRLPAMIQAGRGDWQAMLQREARRRALQAEEPLSEQAWSRR